MTDTTRTHRRPRSRSGEATMQEESRRQDLIRELDGAHARACREQLKVLRLILRAEGEEAWVGSGARDLPHWISMRYGVSSWKAHRLVAAARALQNLPRLELALARGELSLDKVLELARLARPETEERLIRWARGVSPRCIRRRAELAARPDPHEPQEAASARFCSWWWLDEGRRLGLAAELPAAEGAVVVGALDRLSREVPVMPGEEDACHTDARRADALVAVCSARLGADPEADRTTVVLHAPVEALVSGDRSCELEAGGIIHPEVARRLLCTARVQAVIEDRDREAVGMGRTSRVPTHSMMRHLRYRDGGCRFPGCGARAFTQAHHMVWWTRGGRTDLENLVLICTFHHRLVHELRWSVRRGGDGLVRWFRPDGRRFHPGPAPPHEIDDGQSALGLAAS